MVYNLADVLNCVFIKLNWRFFSLLAFAKGSASKLTVRRVLEVIHQVSCALDACIGQFTDFFTVKTIPPSAIELLVEVKDELGVDEIGKRVTHITWVIMIDR